MGFLAEPPSKELGLWRWQFYVQRPKKRWQPRGNKASEKAQQSKKWLIVNTCMNSSLQLVAHTCTWDGPACYIQSLITTIQCMDQSLIWTNVWTIQLTGPYIAWPVNWMSSLGWTGSTLSNQLGSANPRQVGFTNRGWLIVGATGGPISSQTSFSNEDIIRKSGSDLCRSFRVIVQECNNRDKGIYHQISLFLNFFW